MPRPLRRREYRIIFGTSNAQEGWTDVLATQRNTVAATWERLTADPRPMTPPATE